MPTVFPSWPDGTVWEILKVNNDTKAELLHLNARAQSRAVIRRRRRSPGFTLIEILVVVAIIGILIAILLPALSKARDQARSVSCRSNMKQLMAGMVMYSTEFKVLPGTHGLFWMQSLFTREWSRPAGSTWDGARDRFSGITYYPAYQQPYYSDPEFLADVPTKGTLFRYTKQEALYVCPSDNPGESNDTALGGGGNGRLSYSMNAYIGYKSPDSLGSFTYVADSNNNLLPGKQKRVSFKAGQRVVMSPSRYTAMFEDHPAYHTNANYPDGSFNCIDAIATRHMFKAGSSDDTSEGRSSLAYLDGHVDAPLYRAKTLGRELFAEFGQPHFWRDGGLPDRANMAAFVRRIPGNCPW